MARGSGRLESKQPQEGKEGVAIALLPFQEQSYAGRKIFPAPTAAGSQIGEAPEE